MKNLKLYDIKFSGLKNGKHQFEYDIDRSFLELFDYEEAKDCKIKVEIELNKSESMLEFFIKSYGSVSVPCDISNELYDQAINGELNFIAKFGEEFNDERDDLIILPYNEHTINLAQQIYENIVLNIPLKRIHPDIASGKKKVKNQAYIINDFDENDTNKEQNYDPRWDALKKLLTDKKK